MKTMQITGIRELRCIEAPKPDIKAGGDVLVRITTVGVCGSDVHYYETGRIGAQVLKFPHRVGHECAGVVEDIGSEVKRVKRGERVAVDPAMPCGTCDQCLKGRENTCRRMKFLGVPGEADGCFAEFIVMPEECLFRIPTTMSDAAATVCEPFAIALYAARRPGLGGASRVGVLGNGPVGLSVMLGCKLEGAARIYATDRLDYRRAVAEAHGACWSGNPDREDVVREILRREPQGLDAVFECAGQQETMDQAVKLLTPGGTLVLVGIPRTDRVAFEIHELRRKDITIVNIRRQNRMQGDAVALAASGKASLDFMVTHRVPFEQAGEAFDLVSGYRDGVIKAVVTV